MKRSILALALTLGLALTAGPAYADETPQQDTTVAPATTTPDEPEVVTPAPDDVPEPAVEEEPTAPVDEPAAPVDQPAPAKADNKPTTHPDEFKAYETTVCWKITAPDPDIWPGQQRTACPGDTTGVCEPARYQLDVYWIRDKADEDYLAGLTVLNSASDDARLEPHDYSVFTVPGDEDECIPPEPETTVKSTSTSDYQCGDTFKTVTTEEITTEWYLAEGVWLPGVSTVYYEEWVPVPVVACPTEPKHDKPKSHRDTTTVAAVTPVVNEDRFLPNTGGTSQGWLYGGVASVFGALGVLLGAAYRRRRV